LPMGRDLEFVMEWFRRYYSATPPPPPPRFINREFGFMFFDKSFVQRHIGFRRVPDLASFLIGNVPSHVYYSSAYYEDPGAGTMDEKRWLGADLIFDLDADHVPGAQSLAYGEMLARVKEEMLRLLDDFLMGDLGFREEDLRVVFSGGRGYHVHVHDARLVGMKSHERREIVDHISGTNLDMEWVFPERAYDKREFRQNIKVNRIRHIPPPNSGGWKGRMRTGVEWLLEEMRFLSVEEVIGRFPSLSGANPKLVEGMLHDIYDKRGEVDGGILMLQKSRMECFSDVRHQALFMELLEKEVKGRFTSAIDEPVTSDIKRLIRLPASLHGKTGLRVAPMLREELDSFDPLGDAIPDIFPEKEVEVFVKQRTEIDLRHQHFDVEGWTEVPIYAAIFLICRGSATLDPVQEGD